MRADTHGVDTTTKGLKMRVSAVIASLQRCISSILCVFARFFSKCNYRTTGACMGTSTAVLTAGSKLDQNTERNRTTPTSVNYHFTRKCNYKCGFCFHTAKTSFVLPLEEAKRGLRLLKESGKLCILVSFFFFVLHADPF